MSWFVNILVAIDEMGNAITGGDPHETISSRAGKAARKGSWWACRLCAFLNRLDHNHCEKAIHTETIQKAMDA